MKFLFTLFLLSVSLPAFAKNLSLVVIGVGDVREFSVTENGRTLDFQDGKHPDGKRLLRKWIDLKGGQKKCARTNVPAPVGAVYSDSCYLSMTVKATLRVNGFSLPFDHFDGIAYYRGEGNDPHRDIYYPSEGQGLLAKDFSSLLTKEASDLLYDVNHGIPVYENEHGVRAYTKQLRIYIDQGTGEVDSWNVEHVPSV